MARKVVKPRGRNWAAYVPAMERERRAAKAKAKRPPKVTKAEAARAFKLTAKGKAEVAAARKAARVRQAASPKLGVSFRQVFNHLKGIAINPTISDIEDRRLQAGLRDPGAASDRAFRVDSEGKVERRVSRSTVLGYMFRLKAYLADLDGAEAAMYAAVERDVADCAAGLVKLGYSTKLAYDRALMALDDSIRLVQAGAPLGRRKLRPAIAAARKAGRRIVRRSTPF